MEYNECQVIAKLKKKKEPLISIVPCDEYTRMVQNNFDYTFTGESKFYPYELPSEISKIDFQIMVIAGASGSGKSTLLKEFDTDKYNYATSSYDSTKAIVSNFDTPEEASFKLSAVGLNSMPVWCRPRKRIECWRGIQSRHCIES